MGTNHIAPQLLRLTPLFPLQLADIVGDKALHALLLETTFRNLRILLLSERLKTETSERSLLKNLGSWLGKLTLARNKPILFKDLDLKTILYDAYEQGKMIAVLPFINKARPAIPTASVQAIDSGSNCPFGIQQVLH